MSVPPQMIQVKRKRTDDGPVTFLRIEQSTKRHRRGAFLYQRRDPEAALAAINGGTSSAHGQPTDRVPTIKATRPGDENLPLDAVRRSHAAATGGGGDSIGPDIATARITTPQKTRPSLAASHSSPGRIEPSSYDSLARDVAQRALPTVPASVASRVMLQPRRFHLSRKHMMGQQSASGSRGVKASHASKKGLGPATFVERSSNRKRGGEPRTPTTTERPTAVANGDLQAEGGGGPAAASTGAETPRKLKPPSRRAGVSRPAGPRLPDSFVNRWDTDMDQLAREMNEYTLDLIARDLEKIKERDDAAAPKPRSAAQTPVKSSSNNITAPMPLSSPSPRRFKPHAPAKRYAERHSEDEAAAAASAAAAAFAEAQAQLRDETSMDVDEASTTEEEDEGDYVIDTYIRVAADTITTEATPDQVGLLVLDNEPDIDYFYGEESDSEEEFEDDEDENAENYYTADYPDDEVASGDEFDRDAYLYQKGISEFDQGSGSDSEDEDGDDDEGGNHSSRRLKITIGRPQNLPPLY